MKNIIPCISILLTACVTDGSALVYGTAREPINIEQVKIYRIEPDIPFVNIAFVRAEAEEWGDQQEMLDDALEELKKQAAKVGANGIILTSMKEITEEGVGVTNTSIGSYLYTISEDSLHLQGEAIFIEDK